MSARTTSRSIFSRLLGWLVRGILILFVLAMLLAGAWLGYAWYASGVREKQTAEQLDAGQGRFITVAGASLHLREWGPVGGPVMLLVHGTGGWSGSWFGLPQVLGNAGWRVVAMDLPPFGLSSLSADARQEYGAYGRQAQAGRIDAVIAQLGAPVTLLAHSFGAGPSLEAAMHAGVRLRQLVLVDPAIGLGPNGEAPVCSELPLVARTVLANDPLRTMLVAATVSWPGFTAPLLRSFVYRTEVMTGPVVDAFQLPFSRRGFTADMGDYIRGFVRGNCEAADSLDMEKVAAWASKGPPVTLLWGDRDSITPIAQAAVLQRILHGAELDVLPGVGHIPHVEDPDHFPPALLKVLRR